ncbi:MAG: hypothetical protein GX799_11420 [Crenarchaeota archaeon]|nr:hypothetical protein [Thermoproteota archaeon]
MQIFENGPSTSVGINKPTLTIYSTSSASTFDFMVEVSGTLTFNGTAISETPIL